MTSVTSPPSSPIHDQRSSDGSFTASTSQSTTPRQPGFGFAMKRNFVPTTGANPSGRPPAPVAVHSGTSAGSVTARQTFATGWG